jgi:TrmH family RNA methyltransferase
MSWDELQAKRQHVALTGLVPSGGISPHALPQQDHLFVVGNEARGIPTSWISDCDHLMTLAMPGQTESLNAAIAGSITLYLYYYERTR